MLNKIKYIDLFAGIGGFHQAMNGFHTECVFSSEWDKEAAKTYFKNYGINLEKYQIQRIGIFGSSAKNKIYFI